MPSRRSHAILLMRLTIACLIAFMATGPVVAQTPAATDKPAASPSPSTPAPTLAPAKFELGGHGWIAWRDPQDRVTSLLHLPPRTAGSAPAAGEPGRISVDGVARMAPGFRQAVDHIAWCGNRVFVVLREDRVSSAPEADWSRRILSVSVLRSGVGGLDGWEYPPGRPEFITTLPARDVEVVAFAATRFGPAAILRHSARSTWFLPVPGSTEPLRVGSLELVVYLGSAWHRLPLPEGLADMDAGAVAAGGSSRPTLWLCGQDRGARYSPGAGRDTLTLFAFDPAARLLTSLTTDLPPTAKPSDVLLSPAWTRLDFAAADTSGMPISAPDEVFLVDGVVGACSRRDSPQGGELQLCLWPQQTPRGSLDLARVPRAARAPAIEGVPPVYALAPMDGSGRVAIVWQPSAARTEGASTSADAAATGTGLAGLEIREISVTTGKVLFSGPLKSPQWLTVREYQLLAVLLVLIMAAVVVFVLRTEVNAGTQLPVGVMLAEPSRRMLGAFIDYLPAALLIEAMVALPTGSLFLPSRMLGEDFRPGAIMAALALAGTLATLGECFFGRSLGKLLTGTAVAGIRLPVRERPVVSSSTSTAAEPTVVRDSIALGRPAPWQCLVRNLVKWTLPVVGVFILFDTRRRHPGDVLARTMVLLTETEPPPPQP